MKDPNHDLVQQLSEKLDSLWRYDEYIKNMKAGGGCDTCSVLWQKLKEDEQKHVNMLRDEIIRHVEEGRFE